MPSSPTTATDLRELNRALDLVVVGSGAGGLAAAVAAAHAGLQVVVLEKESLIGGTTAWSGGWMWIPRRRLCWADLYLRNELGHDIYKGQQPWIQAYLQQGPETIRCFEGWLNVRFESDIDTPDFHERFLGWSKGSRALRVPKLDGHRLLEAGELDRVRPPLKELTLLGRPIETGEELRRLLPLRAASLLPMLGAMLSHYTDVLSHGCSLHIVNGQALVSRLLLAALQVEGRPVRVLTQARVSGLELPRLATETDSPAVRVEFADAAIVLRPRVGVVLACGGFPHDVRRKRQLMDHAPTGTEHYSAAPRTNSGEGLRLGESIGGVVEPTPFAPAGWVTVSLWRRKDGSTVAFPHLVDVTKPGLIAVGRDGRRYADESGSYHDLVKNALASAPPRQPPETWLIGDVRAAARHGFGAVTLPYWPFSHWARRSGYLKTGRDISSLAARCGIDAAGLARTLTNYNANVGHKRDPTWKRGDPLYDRSQGDWTRPFDQSRCLAPIDRPPYFAVRVHAGSLGTFAGLRTDTWARVLNDERKSIAGLWAVGNDMAHPFAGAYPASGITLGAALIFGHRAAISATVRKNELMSQGRG